jgi:glycosyltransferase involved in cell wall biosynthesis
VKDIEGKISVIMPAHNEGRHIIPSIKETMHTFNEFGCDYEIIIIDDGSTDDTYEKIKEMAADFTNVSAKRNRRNFGKGRALKKAFRYATGDYVVFLDADLDLHPRQVKILFEAMKNNETDVVIGSKRHPESEINYPLSRKIISSGYYYFIKILFGLPVRDTQTGLKLFKWQVLKDVFGKVLIKKYAFDLELLVNAHHLGYRITEVPITLDFRRVNGRIKTIDIWHTLQDTLAIAYRLYILRYYDKV